MSAPSGGITALSFKYLIAYITSILVQAHNEVWTEHRIKWKTVVAFVGCSECHDVSSAFKCKRLNPSLLLPR